MLRNSEGTLSSQESEKVQRALVDPSPDMIEAFLDFSRDYSDSRISIFFETKRAYQAKVRKAGGANRCSAYTIATDWFFIATHQGDDNDEFVDAYVLRWSNVTVKNNNHQ